MKNHPLDSRNVRLPATASRRGAMVVLCAVFMVIFLIAAAFSVDVAFMMLTRTQLRSATDASARAGAEALSRLQSVPGARQTAKDVAAQNFVAGDPLIVDDADILFGNAVVLSTGEVQFTANTAPTNGIQVIGRRERASASGSVALFFGRALGVDDFQPVMSATAVQVDRDICIVVDRSSSMKLSLDLRDATMSSRDPRFCQPPHPTDSRWAALATAVQAFTDALATTIQEETVGLVSYSSRFTACGVSNNASDIDQRLTIDHRLVDAAMQRISQRVFNGNTNISAGIDSGVQVLTDVARARPFANKTMIVFTDGHGNEGRSPDWAAQDAAARGIVVHTVTFGTGANQAQMQGVAAAAGGNHYHAPDAQALVDIFREIALTLPVVLTE